MSKDAIPPPLHHYSSSNPFGNCTVLLEKGKRCNRPQKAPCHRYYPCRHEGCKYNQASSIEARDKHEAMAHGSGW